MMGGRLPRQLHAGAWWLWAIGLGAAATRTTNPLLLVLILAVIALVVSARRSTTGAFGPYIVIALVVIAIRVLFRIVFGGDFGDHVLFELPRAELPAWWAGVTLGGPVTAESLVAALSDGLRLATIVMCVGAANALADPRRLLRSLPRALYDVGAAAVIALSLAPQLIESVGRVRRARLLRGTTGTGLRSLRSLRSLLVPVLTDTLDRSLALAAAMDSRGFGRLGPAPARHRRLGTGLGIGTVVLLGASVAGIVGGALPSAVAVAGIGLSGVTGVGAMSVTGQSVGRTVYRPDPWWRDEWVTVVAGLAAAAAVWTVGATDPISVVPSLQPLTWPTLSPLAAAGIVAAALPAWLSPAGVDG